MNGGICSKQGESMGVVHERMVKLTLDFFFISLSCGKESGKVIYF